MEIVLSHDRLIIVDAGVDVTALARVLDLSGAAALGDDALAPGDNAQMIPVPSDVRVWIAADHTDMRCDMNSLALRIQQALRRDPHAGDLYVFRGRSGKLIKIFWYDGLGASLYAKRLEKGRFVWPATKEGVVPITPGQLGYLLEGIDWRWRANKALCLVTADAAD
jgi:transposase